MTSFMINLYPPSSLLYLHQAVAPDWFRHSQLGCSIVLPTRSSFVRHKACHSLSEIMPPQTGSGWDSPAHLGLRWFVVSASEHTREVKNQEEMQSLISQPVAPIQYAHWHWSRCVKSELPAKSESAALDNNNILCLIMWLLLYSPLCRERERLQQSEETWTFIHMAFRQYYDCLVHSRGKWREYITSLYFHDRDYMELFICAQADLDELLQEVHEMRQIWTLWIHTLKLLCTLTLPRWHEENIYMLI